MPISARVLADSLAPCGARLTTMEWVCPMYLQGEINTHKMLSKNSASSRAIPTEKMIQRAIDDPFVPVYLGANQKGMQAGTELDEDARTLALSAWLDGLDAAVKSARAMSVAHKQIANRPLGPYLWTTIIISGTEWSNLYGLRNHSDAEPHFWDLARKAVAAMEASTPVQLAAGQWHLPLVYHDPDDIQMLDAMVEAGQLKFPEDFIKISVGRVARVSYLTHSGKRDVYEDIALHDRLVAQEIKHASPAEHVAQAMDYPEWWKDYAASEALGVYGTFENIRDLINIEGQARERPALYGTKKHQLLAAMLRQMQSGNFYGFSQYRKQLKNEHIGGYMP